MIVLNKVSTIPDIEARRVRAAIEALNPGALVVSADYGQVPLENILNTKVGAWEGFVLFTLLPHFQRLPTTSNHTLVSDLTWTRHRTRPAGCASLEVSLDI